MSYQLILNEPKKKNQKGTKAVGERVLFNDLPTGSKTYLLYYPPFTNRNMELESKLREFGKDADKNVFVNIGTLGDPNFDLLATKFGGFSDLPVVIITGNPEVASHPDKFEKTFVKFEGKTFNSPDLAIECMEKVVLLFIQGRFAEALRQPGKYNRKALLSSLRAVILSGLRGLKGIEFNVGLLGVKFELKNGGD
jgi:hypothetical protein